MSPYEPSYVELDAVYWLPKPRGKRYPCRLELTDKDVEACEVALYEEGRDW